MLNKPLLMATGLICALALLGGSLIGCSSSSTGTQSSSAAQQSGAVTQQPTVQTGTQPGNPSPQQGSAATGQQQPGRGGNMDAVLTRAAGIIGISADKFITAFNNALPQGQPPAPPSGSGTQGQPPAPPSGTGTQGQPNSQFMTEIYTKMAAELNIAADKIAAAMSQAEQELRK